MLDITVLARQTCAQDMRVFILLQLLLLSWPTASLAQRPVPPEPVPGQVPGQVAPQPQDPNRVPEIDRQTQPLDPSANPDEDRNLANEYTGPAILSRGFSATRPTLLQAIRFRPFAGIQGIYDTGLTGLLLNKDGKVRSVDSFGVEAEFGISGRKLFKHDVLGLNYRGTIFHYTPNSFYDGSNHILDLDFAHRAAKHLTINLKESAGVYSNNTALLNSIGLSDASIAGTDYVVTPNTQAFDNRVIFASSQVDTVYQK
ncbi:MAG: hypothetical protein M3Z23_19590, partial [Acidobacteriota bacterium]|nr:hypothetical protein [Acidobacteriota bacterium]